MSRRGEVVGRSRAAHDPRTTTTREGSSLPFGSTPVASVAFSPDGNRLATASLQSGIGLWDAGTGKKVLTLLPGQSALGPGGVAVAFSPDGTRLASVVSPRDSPVTLWDLTQRQRVLLTLSMGRDCVAFSPDGKLPGQPAHSDKGCGQGVGRGQRQGDR